MRPIVAAILLGISMAALGGSPGGGGGGGGGGGHGGGSSGGAGGGHASGSVHGGGTHISAEAHPGDATHAPSTSLAGSLRGWWHHRHESFAQSTKQWANPCTDEQRRAHKCDLERSPER
jgi:hypothetical protein